MEVESKNKLKLIHLQDLSAQGLGTICVKEGFVIFSVERLREYYGRYSPKSRLLYLGIRGKFYDPNYKGEMVPSPLPPSLTRSKVEDRNYFSSLVTLLLTTSKHHGSSRE